ncbi:Metallo-dependent hydrolase [Parathielavia hyrcaniae]|uniref:adenosine deaminase n=1 Tax=Parathielavia hyrcaniae TaxID=113614 RepID=A0AAN6T3B8_9PEZI|nr:Metallo-dependent hydrolase [Parathielavia hyrcaniae]
MGRSDDSLDAPEPNHYAQKTSEDHQQTLSDIVKLTRRRRLVQRFANRFRSSHSDKDDQLAKKLAVEGGVGEGRLQAEAEQPKQDEAILAPLTGMVVGAQGSRVVEDRGQNEPKRSRQSDALAASPADTTLDVPWGEAVKAGGQAASRQPTQDETTDPPIGKVLEVPDHFLCDLRDVLEKCQFSLESPSELTEELEGKLALYSGEKVKEYDVLRQQGTRHEGSLGFEYACTKKASKTEIAANEVLQHLKKNDIARFYNKRDTERIGYGGQKHKRFYGDHFLSNVDLIERTQLFALCRTMPKGAHLHIHFNANLVPSFLLSIARDQERMFIWSDIPLLQAEAFDLCRIQFSIMNEAAVEANGRGNPFDARYEKGQVMQFRHFLRAYPGEEEAALDWLQKKLVFQEEEAHDLLQTQTGAWEKFNSRTQMMKGLFNYETAYRKYTRQCLEEFAAENIQYAEIRPNFMSSNQVWKDDGSYRIDNVGIMHLIIEEYEAFQNGENGQRGHNRDVVKGLKVIYCTPRSFSEKQVGDALIQCFQFKMDKRFSKYIAGFDLVGEEGEGKPLNFFRKQFLEFQALCKAANTEIPFLFHCGETLDIGTDTDGNLMDALLLGAKRIGHGFALPRHPYVMAKMKQHNVCVEVCPISNEILGLTPRISGHSAYSLLANNVPCTISTDNGTLFRSRLSHDFYQIMAGKSDMTLHGLRQLAEWSIEHSCMEPDLMQEVREAWEERWDEFCNQIVGGEFTIRDDAGDMAAEADFGVYKPPIGPPGL